MNFLELNRMETSAYATVGVLLLNKQLFCYVLEPPKKQNEKNESCIPTGQYMCRRYDSERFKCPCLRIIDVPGREGIVVHPGNRPKDTDGCLLPGAYTGFVDSDRFVYKSAATLKALMSEIKDICHLTIREIF